MDRTFAPPYHPVMGEEMKAALLARGVEMPAPDLVVLGEDLDPERFEAGVRLAPFSRVEGSQTLLRSGTVIGDQGPARVKNCVCGRRVVLGSGSFEESLFQDGASVGPSAHVRPGTLFEEEARAAHAVGTKQTILLPFATLGSNVNFCDCLLSGGTGPRDHSEVGSGFIHFNFTPFGAGGDKATPSLFGDVARGVWLRERRIFLGGAGGVVGPAHVGFGSVLAAGGIYRRDHLEDRLVLGEPPLQGERELDPRLLRRVQERLAKNLHYMAQLVALWHVYRQLRWSLFERDPLGRELVRFGLDLIGGALRERERQLCAWGGGLAQSAVALEERAPHDPEIILQRELGAALGHLKGFSRPDPEGLPQEPGPKLRKALLESGGSWLAWIGALDSEAVAEGRLWLSKLALAWLKAPEGAGPLSAWASLSQN